MALARYFGRIGYVEIEDPNGNMVKFGGDGKECLDIKFEVQKVYGIYSNFKVSILGLSGETINDLTYFNPADSYSNSRRINVYAGYSEMGGAELLAHGYIFTSKPTNPPNRWLELNCCRYYALKKTIEKPEILTGKTVNEIFERCAKEMGVKPVWEAKKLDGSKKVSAFQISGSVDLLSEKFAGTFGCICNLLDSETLVCRDRSEFRDEPTDVKELNIYTGFIDTVGIDVGGAKFRVRMNTRYQTGDWLHFTSQVNPKYNDYYYIVDVKYVGHLRGNDWYCELTTLRKCNKKGEA